MTTIAVARIALSDSYWYRLEAGFNGRIATDTVTWYEPNSRIYPMSLDPESLYVQLGRLIETMPDLLSPVTADTSMWLGRAVALVEESGDLTDAVALRVASDSLNPVLGHKNAGKIVAILHRALARAELKVSAATSGAFIPVGAGFTAIAALSKIMSTADSNVLIVDPYADEKVLTDFAVLVREGTLVRVLSDKRTVASSLRPVAQRWAEQYGASRPLEVRVTPPRALHDRLIVVDNAQVWTLTQSLKDFAARSPASIVRSDAGTASLKVEAYNGIWEGATVLV
ncbi:hypothetical protein WK80_25800 [Burkholderia multivorans]|nr:hypothetical protein WK80_25800 [Burkholderia multivorans]